MTALQVLKLRRVGLRDTDCEILADVVGIRLRSLDVRDNQLTDESVRTLLDKCFHHTRDVQEAQRRAHEVDGNNEDWPVGLPRPDPYVLDQFRGDDVDERFVRRLTQAVVGRMPTEDLPPTGITHLYIANNFVTIEGLASLVKTKNLHVLDAGELDTAKALGRPRTMSSLSSPVAQSFYVPGAEKLTGILETFAAENLTYLRLNHAVLTAPAVTKEEDLVELDNGSAEEQRRPRQSELEGVAVLTPELQGDNIRAVEVDAAVPIYELDGASAAPRYELEVDPIQIVVSPAADKTAFPRDLPLPPPSNSSASAPEAVEDDEEIVLTPTGLSSFAQGVNGVPISNLPAAQISNLSLDRANSTPDDPAILHAKLLSRRANLRQPIRDQSRGLLPGRLPNLRILTLTEVPPTTTSKILIQNLKSFIADCALEHYLAIAQADVESAFTRLRSYHHHPIHPQSPLRLSTPNPRAASLFAQRTLILE